MPRLFRCLRLGLVRSGPGLDTEPVGELLPGTEIIALDSTTLPSGVQRVQFDAGQPAGWVSQTVSGRGRLARSIPILHDLGELDVLLAAPGPAPLSLKEKMTLSLLASGEVAPEKVEQTAEEAAARAELKRLAVQGVQGAAEALEELEIGTRVFMSIDEHQAACAQARVAGDDDGGYEVSDESEDPLGGFSSSDEDDRGDNDSGSSCRHSMHHARASTMRMSMTFTPSRPSGSLLTSSDDEGDAARPKHEAYSSSDDEGAELGEDEEYEMTMQFNDVKDTRRTTQLQQHNALSAYPEGKENEEDEDEEDADEEDDVAGPVESAVVTMSIDEHKATSERERLRQSAEEAVCEDPFGFAPEEEEEEEEEQRSSIRRSSHRQSMSFRPSCGRGRSSSGDDTDEPMGAEDNSEATSSFAYRPSCGQAGGTALGLFVEEVDESNLSSSSEDRSRTSSLLAEQELAAKEAELIRRQAELVCQQAAQSLSSTTHTTAQVRPGGADNAMNTRIQTQDEQDAAAQAAARAEIEKLAAQGSEIEQLAAKEALAELEAQTRAAAAQPLAGAKEAKQQDDDSFDAHDEDTPYVSSDEDDETIRKRISMAVDVQSPTTYTSSDDEDNSNHDDGYEMTMDFKEVMKGRRTTHMQSAPSGMPVVLDLGDLEEQSEESFSGSSEEEKSRHSSLLLQPQATDDSSHQQIEENDTEEEESTPIPMEDLRINKLQVQIKAAMREKEKQERRQQAIQQAKVAAAERWHLEEQARLKKEEEARQQAAKDAKAQKAKERQAEIKRQAAELKAKVKAEVEEAAAMKEAKRQGENSRASASGRAAAAHAKADAAEQKLEQAKQAARAKLKQKRSSTKQQGGSKDRPQNSRRDRPQNPMTAAKQNEAAQRNKENEHGVGLPPATPMQRNKGDPASKNGAMTTGRKTGRKRVYRPETFGDAPCAEDGGFSLFTDKNGRDCR